MIERTRFSKCYSDYENSLGLIPKKENCGYNDAGRRVFNIHATDLYNVLLKGNWQELEEKYHVLFPTLSTQRTLSTLSKNTEDTEDSENTENGGSNMVLSHFEFEQGKETSSKEADDLQAKISYVKTIITQSQDFDSDLIEQKYPGFLTRLIQNGTVIKTGKKLLWNGG